MNIEDIMDKLMQDEMISRKMLATLSAIDGNPNNQENNHDLDIAAA